MLFYRCYGRDIFSVYFFVINSFVRGEGGVFLFAEPYDSNTLAGFSPHLPFFSFVDYEELICSDRGCGPAADSLGE